MLLPGVVRGLRERVGLSFRTLRSLHRWRAFVNYFDSIGAETYSPFL